MNEFATFGIVVGIGTIIALIGIGWMIVSERLLNTDKSLKALSKEIRMIKEKLDI